METFIHNYRYDEELDGTFRVLIREYSNDLSISLYGWARRTGNISPTLTAVHGLRDQSGSPKGSTRRWYASKNGKCAVWTYRPEARRSPKIHLREDEVVQGHLIIFFRSKKTAVVDPVIILSVAPLVSDQYHHHHHQQQHQQALAAGR